MNGCEFLIEKDRAHKKTHNNDINVLVFNYITRNIMKTISPILIVLILLFSCKKKDDVFVSSPAGTPGNTSIESFQDMNVEDGFNFRTSENITLPFHLHKDTIKLVPSPKLENVYYINF